MQPQLLAPPSESRRLTPIAPNSIDEVRDVVRAAIAGPEPLEPVGGGTQLHVGYSADCPLVPVSLKRLQAVVEYKPADFLIVAQAGLTLAALNEIAAEHGQTLPIQVAFPERQTLGGIVASRSSSLTRAGNGSVRDWLIGCEAVGGEGQLIASGGDLAKLYCGSWGTLGVLTQTAFRLAALPAASKTLLIALSPQRNSEEALDALSQSLPPLTFVILINAVAAAEVLGQDAPPAQYLAVGIDGMTLQVEAISRRVEAALTPFTLQTLDLPSAIAERLRTALCSLPLKPDAPLAVRCSILPSQVGAFARMLEWTARRWGFRAETMADAVCGVVWAHISPIDPEEAVREAWTRLYPDLRDKLDRVGGTSVLERMPQDWRDAGCPVWSPVLDDSAQMRQIKAVFDPHGIFRPGRFFGHL